jgi:hypothetical protein
LEGDPFHLSPIAKFPAAGPNIVQGKPPDFSSIAFVEMDKLRPRNEDSEPAPRFHDDRQ